VVIDGKLDPHPAEAPIVRGMVDSFLTGSSLRGIAKRLNAQGVKPPRLVFYEEATAKGYRAKVPPATSWSYVAVRGVLTAPALAGLISHAGQLCRDEHGELIRAGLGIVSLAERAQILAELQRRATVGSTRQSARREAVREAQPRYLLTGFVRCGECGKALQRIETARGGVYYRCAAKGHGQTCRGVSSPAGFWDPRSCAESSRGAPPVGGRSATTPGGLRAGTWDDPSLAQRRAVLADAVRAVWVYGTYLPIDHRVHIVW
jgi:Recombinase zinc beta ribbon domain/Recombinase